MGPIEEFHIRVLYLIGAVSVPILLRKPIRYPEKPGSKWFAVTIGAVSLWLGSVGLYYFVHSLSGSLVLYNLVMFSVTICFAGWILIAVEFATGKSAPRIILGALATFALVHFVLLWTNFFWMHELFFESTAFVDDGGGLNVPRGPLFWVHIVIVYILVFLSTVLFVGEWANSSGLRRRQAGILAVTPLFGVAASLLWFAEVLPFLHDPTPVGVTIGVVLLSWALYRAEFLEIVPVGRKTAVEEMVDATIILGDENRILDWNSAARALFEPTDATVGMPADAFFEPVPPEMLTAFTSASQTDTQVSFELDGRERHFSVSTTPLESGHADPLGSVVVVRDITDLKRREEQLLQQNEYLDQFASIVSHDLQGPLMDIRGSAEMAVQSGNVSHIDHVLDATDRIEGLIDDLLRLARTGRQIESVEPVEISTVVESAWGRVWGQNAELIVDTDRSVHADPNRLQQLLENLFRNAVEHGSTDRNSLTSEDAVEYSFAETRDGEGSVIGFDDPNGTDTGIRDAADSNGSVRITVGLQPDGFFVEDDGSGIPEAARERIFERGYTTSEDGTGLGLGIVRQIAGAHGWSIHVREGRSGGARFEITDVDVVE
nr:histidine kinase N-terminal 7TM domain-containing protein [Natrinema halophilum]